MKKFIFIPVVNHFDLLERAVKSLTPEIYDEYIIFNNSNSDIPENIFGEIAFGIMRPDIRMSFRDTQNTMRKYAVDNGYDYYSFMHNDGEVKNGADKKLVDYIEDLTENWGIVFTHYDVLCAFNTKAVIEVGEWGDKDWPSQMSGYYLDCDYYRRFRKLGYTTNNLTGANISHASSNTIKSTQELTIYKREINAVRDHYINKWGGEPGFEIR